MKRMVYIVILCVFLTVPSNSINKADNQEFLITTLERELRQPDYLKTVLPDDFSGRPIHGDDRTAPFIVGNSNHKILIQQRRRSKALMIDVA